MSELTEERIRSIMAGAGDADDWEWDEIERLAIASLSQPEREGWVGGVYVASRASIPERSAMWRRYRAEGVPIISSWIDEAGPGETADLGELWERILSEVSKSCGVVLYAEQDDFPLKGAFVEIGMALALNKRIAVVLDFEPLGDSLRPIGSWIRHRNVARYSSVSEAFAALQSEEK